MYAVKNADRGAPSCSLAQPRKVETRMNMSLAFIRNSCASYFLLLPLCVHIFALLFDLRILL